MDPHPKNEEEREAALDRIRASRAQPDLLNSQSAVLRMVKSRRGGSRMITMALDRR